MVRDESRIAGVAAWICPQTHVRARAGKQLLDEEVPVAPQTGKHGGLDRAPDPLASGGGIGIAREPFPVGEQRRRSRLLPQQCVERIDHPLHVHAR